jgi:hypothetical protein
MQPDLAERWSAVMESAATAEEAARELSQRIETLIASREEDPARERIATLAEKISALEERVRGEIALCQSEITEAGDVLEAGVEQARTIVQEAATEAREVAQEFCEAVPAAAQQVRDTIAEEAPRRVEELGAFTQQQLADLLRRAESLWTDATREAQERMDAALAEGATRLDGEVRGAIEAAQQSVQRCSQLKDDIERTAARVGEIVALFSDSMRATQTGLNVTAGTLSDVVGMLSDVA